MDEQLPQLAGEKLPQLKLESLLKFKLIPSTSLLAIAGMEIVSLENPEEVEQGSGIPASPWEVKMWKVLLLQEEELDQLRKDNRRLKARLKAAIT